VVPTSWPGGLLFAAYWSSWSSIILHMGGYDTGPIDVLRTGGLPDCRFAICKYMCGKYCWKVCVQYFMGSR
jgi:hypothetical protein